MQRGFFKNSVGDLLPALRFLGGLHNFCNFVVIFSLINVTMICRRATFYRYGNDQILPKTCSWNSKSAEAKNYVINYIRYTMLKNNFLWFRLGHMTVMRISK